MSRKKCHSSVEMLNEIYPNTNKDENGFRKGMKKKILEKLKNKKEVENNGD